MRLWLVLAALTALGLGGSLAGPASAQNVREAEQAEPEQQDAKAKYADRKTGNPLLCAQANGDESGAYKCKPASQRSLGDRVWRWVFRAGRDPIAIFTLLLLGVGVWQVGIAQRTAHRQLRAYISPESVGISDGTFMDPPTDVGLVRGGTIMKNSGQTPAYRVITWAAIDVVRVSEEHTLKLPEKMNVVSVAALGPGAVSSHSRSFGRALTPHEISEIETHKSAVYLYGGCTYRDIFGKAHKTDYRVKYSGNWPPPASLVMNYCDEGNEAD